MHLVQIAAATSIAAAFVLAAPTGAAVADPPSGLIPPANSIVGVGADSTEYLLDQVALSFDSQSPPPLQKLYSWDAIGTSPLQTKMGSATIVRPNGAVFGLNSMISNTANMIDFVRSDRGRIATDPTASCCCPPVNAAPAPNRASPQSTPQASRQTCPRPMPPGNRQCY